MRSYPLSLISALATLFSLVFVAPAFAESDGSIDLSTFGESLGEKLGIGTFAGGLLMGIIFMAIILVPLMMLLRRRASDTFTIELIFGIALLCFNVAVGWFPVWTMIITIFLVALLFSNKLAGVFG